MQFSTPNLAEIEQILTNLFSKSGCNCHFINPHKTKVILWLERKKNNPDIYHLRIGLQRLLSYPLTDKNGETYWRFDAYPRSSAKGEKEPTNHYIKKQEQIN